MAPCDGLGAVFLHCWHYKSDLPALPSAGVDREVMIMPFTAAELEEMRRADAEIEWNFRLTPEDLAASRQRDRWAVFEALPPEKQRRAAYQRAYCEANREKLAAYQRAYCEANREKLAAYQRAYCEANREKLAASRRAYYEANREKRAAYQRAYREANREKRAAYQRAYREANREKLAASRRAYYEANREKRAAYQRAYREANPEKLAAYQRAYYEANREKRAAYQRWIRDARIARGFTQRDLAQMLGCSRQTISNLETGRARMDAFARADKLREILGQSSED